jgi:translation initiation factor 5
MEQNGKLYLTNDENVLFDVNYRYKISAIEIAYATKKGTKITQLTNLQEFARELLFNKDMLIRIIGKTLSCKSGIDVNNIYYLQGEYSSSQIKDIVYEFIRNYLLCNVCDKPEVSIKCKNNKIKQKCKACGNNEYLTNFNEDMIIHILSKHD